MIAVDFRELRSPVAMALRDMGYALTIKRLDIGDYLVSDRVIVERKGLNDLEASIKDGRFFDQCIKMKNTYERPVIIVEKPSDASYALNTASLYGALASSLVDFGVSIFLSSDTDDTASLISALARREMAEKRPLKLRHYKPKMTLEHWQRYILEGLPGVSAVGARNILEHFGTLRAFFMADKETMSGARGIGKERAARITLLLDAEYNKDDRIGDNKEGEIQDDENNRS